MRLKDVFVIEAAYAGNIGAMEMFKFYQIASDEEKKQLQQLLDAELYDEVWELLKKVTKVNLFPLRK